MANSGITADAAVTAAAFADAVARHTWDATTKGSSPTARMLEWKDWIDAVVTALQARIATDGDFTVSDLTVDTLTATTTVDAADVTATDLLLGGRLDASLGAALNADGTDFALSAGWGASAAIVSSSVIGTAARFQLQIFPDGTVAADPTVTLTFPAARATAPVMAIPVVRDASGTGGFWAVDALSTTICRLQFIGTPVSETIETVDCLIIG